MQNVFVSYGGTFLEGRLSGEATAIVELDVNEVVSAKGRSELIREYPNCLGRIRHSFFPCHAPPYVWHAKGGVWMRMLPEPVPLGQGLVGP